MSNGVNGFYNGSIEKINVRRTGPPIKIFQNDCPIITFEGVGDLNSVPNMNLGFTEVFFPGWLGLVDSDAGGSGNFENEPSPSTTAFWLDGPFKEILFNQPISSLSLFYSSRFPVTLQAFNSNGNLVDTTIGPPNVIGEVFDVWSNLSVEAGSNLITRVRYTGVANQTGIDNVEVCQVPLIITCPQDITLRNDPGQCGARVEFPPPDVTGGVPPYMVECTFESGDFFQLGTTTVECTASDSAGNAATCSFKVTVNDTEPPSITCPSDIT
ncbi:HYR domain-containing protein, partial [Cytobacillus sp. FSL H8-0458]|uniref:HYR domain-containing protein n=1 Tax=Cytobacillus sp. FSL H8-0458 TaxID=2975346 RepID=UPI0030FA13C6